MVFFSKNRPFPHIFFSAKKERKKDFLIFWIEKNAFWTAKKSSKNAKKSTFCKGVSPWFLSKNRPFPHIFFLSKKSQKETIFNILESKEFFLHLES